jgi:hypothetical protein
VHAQPCLSVQLCIQGLGEAACSSAGVLILVLQSALLAFIRLQVPLHFLHHHHQITKLSHSINAITFFTVCWCASCAAAAFSAAIGLTPDEVLTQLTLHLLMHITYYKSTPFA